MMRPGLWIVLLLAVAVIGSAIGVVATKYLIRAEFVNIQEARRQRDVLDVEWSRLRLEEASLITQTRIEEIARQTLKMHWPQANEMRVLEISMPTTTPQTIDHHVITLDHQQP
jgi:cell division protein FtsL